MIEFTVKVHRVSGRPMKKKTIHYPIEQEERITIPCTSTSTDLISILSDTFPEAFKSLAETSGIRKFRLSDDPHQLCSDYLSHNGVVHLTVGKFTFPGEE
eukprot:TRINITY_DN11429_c0_g1_i1.p1 TRINITY_DN11429_c0_g1~~TRINITY_DN11429_c0_g1_i1.p1  ORF type:complete len:109 (+),score=25.83 TRINITY_DN11429_c0_g1_i1:28-327(+)